LTFGHVYPTVQTVMKLIEKATCSFSSFLHKRWYWLSYF